MLSAGTTQRHVELHGHANSSLGRRDGGLNETRAPSLEDIRQTGVGSLSDRQLRGIDSNNPSMFPGLDAFPGATKIIGTIIEMNAKLEQELFQEIGAIKWDSFGSPADYQPREVPRALRAVIAAKSQDSAQNAYHKVLFAIGNNHAGTLYPVAPYVVPILIRMSRSDCGWTRWTALEILTDAIHFEGEARVDSGAENTVIPDSFRERIRNASDDFLAILGDPAEFDENREDALAILDGVDIDSERLRSVLSQLDLETGSRRLVAESVHRNAFNIVAKNWLTAHASLTTDSRQ